MAWIFMAAAIVLWFAAPRLRAGWIAMLLRGCAIGLFLGGLLPMWAHWMAGAAPGEPLASVVRGLILFLVIWFPLAKISGLALLWWSIAKAPQERFFAAYNLALFLIFSALSAFVLVFVLLPFGKS